MYRVLLTDEEGLTTVEYALLVALLVAGSIVAWTTFGSIARTKVAAAGNSMNALPPS
jgi:Flp pilus assembly pilin Flp